jgi:hypothetical protein
VHLGAKLIATHSDRGPLTYVMRDPEGNEFCLHWQLSPAPTAVSLLRQYV